jgi:hypothetical protein
MKSNVELAQLLREMGYSEDIIGKIITWYLKDHPEILY